MQANTTENINFLQLPWLVLIITNADTRIGSSITIQVHVICTPSVSVLFIVTLLLSASEPILFIRKHVHNGDIEMESLSPCVHVAPEFPNVLHVHKRFKTRVFGNSVVKLDSTY